MITRSGSYIASLKDSNVRGLFLVDLISDGNLRDDYKREEKTD